MGDDKNTYLPTRRRPTPGSWRVKIERGLIVSRPVAILRAAVVGGIMLAAYVGVSAITNRPEVPATQPAAVPDFEVGQ